MKKIHHLTLKSAVAKYFPLHKEGKAEVEVKEAIAADDKKFVPEHVDEIYDAIVTFKEEGPEQKPKGKRYLVIAPFRDIKDYSKQFNVGDDVSHFEETRLENLVKSNLVETK